MIFLMSIVCTLMIVVVWRGSTKVRQTMLRFGDSFTNSSNSSLPDLHSRDTKH